MRIAIFIDGAYLDFMLQDEFDMILEQKRVDLMLGVDLVTLAATHQITHAALLAGDSDLMPAVSAAKPHGVMVKLWHGSSPHDDLISECDEHRQFTREIIDSMRR